MFTDYEKCVVFLSRSMFNSSDISFYLRPRSSRHYFPGLVSDYLVAQSGFVEKQTSDQVIVWY